MIEELQLFCQVCGRDYELPRRHMLFKGDHDFSPIPRLLPCLHTLCHSCLEEQYEKDDAHLVKCPQCDYEEPILAVDLLPLDVSALKQVVASNSSELLAQCAKCYDPVSSVSWCESCSSALCEFHHQDHKLSVDTSRHNIHTFKEYMDQGKHIVYKFPPISCPHCPLQDCSLYCNTCLHLVSPKGFIDYHKDHQVTDYLDSIGEMTTAVEDAVRLSKSDHEDMMKKAHQVRERLRQLDESESYNSELIVKTFQSLQQKLKKREAELLGNLSAVINTYRTKLQEYMQALVTLDGGVQRVQLCGEALLRDTSGSDVDRMYLVSMADAIEFRADYLNNKLKTLVGEIDGLRDPTCRVNFGNEDLMVMQGLAARLGSMQTGLEDNTDFAGTSETMRNESASEEEIRVSSMFDLCLTVNVRKQNSQRRAQLWEKLPQAGMVQHVMLIEARLVARDQMEDHQRSSDGAKQGRLPDEKNKIFNMQEEKSGRGVLMGQIEIQDKIDRNLLSGQRVKSYFDTVRSDGLPTLRVMKDFVAAV